MRKRVPSRKTRILGGLAVSIFTLVIFALFFSAALRPIAMRSPQVAAVVSAVLVDLANGDRSSQKLGELRVNPVLVAAAQAKANDMAAKGYFAHIAPDGVDPWHWFQQAGYAFDYAGENLAVDFSDSGDVNTAWMNSPTHRENILNPHFTEIGIATAEGMYQGRLTTYIVQEFGTPAGTVKRAHIAISVPSDATKPALALAQPSTPSTSPVNVLGSSVENDGASADTDETIARNDESQNVGIAKVSSDATPAWAYVVGFPRKSLQYAYYIIAALVLLALAIETGLEFEWHHRKHALRAGSLLVLMCALFFAANSFFFAPPIILDTGAHLSL